MIEKDTSRNFWTTYNFWRTEISKLIQSKFRPNSDFTYFWNFWARMTSGDLATPFFEKLKSRASFWYTLYPLSMTFEIWPIFRIFDLGWPLVTSWPPFFKSLRQEGQFDIYFMIFYQSSKFDLFWGFLTLSDLFWPWVTFVDLVTLFFEKLTSRASFWYTIYPL